MASPETRSPATGQGGRADSATTDFNSADATTELLERQTLRLTRVHRCSLPFAEAAARLAFAVAR